MPLQYLRAAPSGDIPDSPKPIFITARFRSGSTFVWQLFKNIEGITCYYEPLNEAKWFLMGRSSKSTDSTHLGVDDYRAEYEGMADLDGIFDPQWAFSYLYMDETHHDPRLKHYLSELIKRAPGRAVLQFNRVDFRLPWLRAHFPQALILHLYRNPREQWVSILNKAKKAENWERIKPGQSYGPDGFYTLEWARDLRHVFPFLEPAGKYPYQLHYLLWRLSYSYGRAYSDFSVCYEDLISNFHEIAGDMLHAMRVINPNISALAKLNLGQPSVRWPDYADEEWFRDMEAQCDEELQAFFSHVAPAKAE